MKKLAHTPGPWIADDGDGEYWGVFQGDDSDGIAYLAEPHDPRSPGLRILRPDEAKANAILMAASPDLYRELAHLVTLLGSLERDGGLNVPGLATLNGARAAIAKAGG